MRRLSLPLVCALAAFVLMYDNHKIVSANVIAKREVNKYTTKYDGIDVNRIVSSKRLMQNYANCLLDNGPCTPEGTELKTYLPDAMATKCSKCSDQQKRISGIVLAHLVENYRDLWEQLLNKYDKTGSFRSEYEGSDADDYEDDE